MDVDKIDRLYKQIESLLAQLEAAISALSNTQRANENLVRWKGEIDSHLIAHRVAFPIDYDNSPRWAVAKLIECERARDSYAERLEKALAGIRDSTFRDAATLRGMADWALTAERPQMSGSECDHEWVDARNEVISSGELCLKCMAIRAGNVDANLRAIKRAERLPACKEPTGYVCTDCNGCGWCEGSPAHTCTTCNGTGRVPNSWGLCEGCPPVEHTDATTRCLPCPRATPAVCKDFAPGADPSRCLYCGVNVESHVTNSEKKDTP